MSKYYFIPVVIFAAFIGNAQSQVYKCISNGKTIFSDAPCSSNKDGSLIQEKRNPEEISNDRIRALEAENLAQQRLQIERERDLYERPRQPTVIKNQYQNLPPPSETWAEKNEKRNREASKGSITNNGGRWDEKAERERIAEKSEIRFIALKPAAAKPYADQNLKSSRPPSLSL